MLVRRRGGLVGKGPRADWHAAQLDAPWLGHSSRRNADIVRRVAGVTKDAVAVLEEAHLSTSSLLRAVSKWGAKALRCLRRHIDEASPQMVDAWFKG